MGMFDSLKRGLQKFTGKVAEEATIKDAPAAAKPAAPPAATPAKPAPAAPKKASVEDDWEAELAAIEAEVAAESAKAAPPPKPAPVPAPAPAAVPQKGTADMTRPAPAAAPAPPPSPPKPAAPAPSPAPKPAAPAPAAKPAPAPPAAPATPKPPVASAPAAMEPPKPAPATFTPVPPAPKPVETPKPAPTPAPTAAPAAPAAAPKPVAPAPAPAPKPAAPAGAAEKGRAIQVEKIDDLLWDLELSLLESDVALPVVEEIKESLKAKIAQIRVGSAEEVPRAVEDALRASLLETLSVKPIDFDTWVLEKTLEKKPVVVMFVGVNGTGKTTSIGRIAFRLKENGYTSVMAAGDTFRAGAIQQLEKHAEKVGVTLVKTTAGGDPAAVAFDAIEHAKSRMKDVVLLDTAGRMQTNTNLMDEMKKIKRVAKPDLIVFVGDSLAGNDAVEQAVQFDKAVGIDAVVLTKVDTDAKGGAALSIAKAVGKPILFLGVGQEYGDIVPYDPQWMVDRIFESA